MCDNPSFAPSHLAQLTHKVSLLLESLQQAPDSLVKNVMVYIFMWCACDVLRCVPGLVWTRRGS